MATRLCTHGITILIVLTIRKLFPLASLAVHFCLNSARLQRAQRMFPPSQYAPPMPDWLPDALRGVHPRTLTKEELHALHRDGAVHIPGVLTNKTIIGTLMQGMHDPHIPGYDYKDWRTNAVLKSVATDGPFAATAASALDVDEISLWATNVFPARGGFPDGFAAPPPEGGVHLDIDFTPGYLLPFVTIWVALTDAKRPLEFIAGSHIRNMQHDCPYGSSLTVQDGCIKKLEADCHGRLSWDVQLGDAIVFYAQTYHWALLHKEPRLGFSMRYIAADHKHDVFDLATMRFTSLLPQWCVPVRNGTYAPVVYPRSSSTIDDQPWPFIPSSFSCLGADVPPVQPSKNLCGSESPAWVQQFLK